MSLTLGQMDPRIMPWIEYVEGRDKFTDDPNDSGGPTWTGITAAAIVGMRESDGSLLFDIDRDGDADADDIRALARLSPEERRTKIAAAYSIIWRKATSGLSWPWSLMVFDATVHHGPQPAIKLLHDALDIEVTPETVTRIIGARTMAAIAHVISMGTTKAAVERYCWNRADLMRQICVKRMKDRQWLLGWLNRVAALERAALGKA